MRRIDIDFRANYQNCDYDAKLMFKCDSLNDLQTAKDAISSFLANKILEASGCKKDGVE